MFLHGFAGSGAAWNAAAGMVDGNLRTRPAEWRAWLERGRRGDVPALPPA